VSESTCTACGAAALAPHLRVRATARPESLIPTTDRFGSALSDIVRCARCGHMQLERFPGEAELASAYGEAASEDYIDEEAGQRETARRVLDRIERHTRPGALLDLGCWVGFLLAEARTRGWRTLGVEPSEWASAYARDRLDLDVRTAGLLDADLPAGEWQAVFLGDVIEHLPHPAGALARIAGLLAPEGVLAMALPDAGSRVARIMGRRWWSVIPTHVQYFTRASVRKLLEREGWSVLYVGTQPKAFSVSYYLSRIGGYSQPLAHLLIRSAEATGLGERIWAPDFRDRMLVVARPGRRVTGT
jgi:SAM-dependent methyltransferase